MDIVSGVPEESNWKGFGKFADRFKTVRMGCKDARLQDVQSLWRQAFIYLNNPSGTLEVSFYVSEYILQSLYEFW